MLVSGIPFKSAVSIQLGPLGLLKLNLGDLGLLKSNLGDGEGQGGLVCCTPWSCKELDTTERMNNNLGLVFLLQNPWPGESSELSLLWNNLHTIFILTCGSRTWGYRT